MPTRVNFTDGSTPWKSAIQQNNLGSSGGYWACDNFSSPGFTKSISSAYLYVSVTNNSSVPNYRLFALTRYVNTLAS